MAIFTFMETKNAFPQLLSLIRERAHDIVYKLTQDDPATFDDEWKRYALGHGQRLKKKPRQWEIPKGKLFKDGVEYGN